MTYIKKLVIHGFKSFGRKVVIDFKPGFSCIIGPNGAGKSNVLDALCFVLGKTSAKGLRVEKASHLIFNGGKKGVPSKKAEVKLILDNSNKIFPVEGDLEISRIIKENGHSVYKINGKTTTRQQVLEILSIAKIRPDAYNIILQGDIVRFVEMSTLERRKIIEDVSGIYIYEEKKEKALRELNRVEKRIHEANIIIAERKAIIDELAKDYKAAKRYKELESIIRRNKKTILEAEYNKEKKRLEKIDKEKERLEKEREKLAEEIKKLNEKIKEIEKEIDAINKEIEKRGEKDQIEAHRKVEALKVEIALKRERLVVLEKEMLENENRKKQLEEEKKRIEEKINRNKKEIENKEKILSTKKKEFERLNKKLNELRGQYSAESLLEKEKEIEEIEKKIEDIEEKIQNMRKEEQELVRKQGQLEASLEGMEEKLKRVEALEKEHKEAVEKLENLKRRYEEINKALSKSLDKGSDLAKQLANAKQKLNSKREELAKKKIKIEAINELVRADKAIQKVLSLKHPKVYGTLAQLGSVSSKYSKALAVAVGNRGKDIVVEDDKVGEEIINYLKKEKIGVVNILPLKQLSPPEISESLRKLKVNPGVEGLAIDLIKFDPKFKKAFQYILGNTLIVKDITTARDIGIGKGIRMVTLDGDLIEARGAMRGGYMKESKSIFLEKEAMAEIEKIEKEIEDYEHLVADLEKEVKKNEEKIEELRKERAEIEAEITKQEKMLHISVGDLEEAKKDKDYIMNEIKKNREELMKLRREIMEKTREIIKLKEKRQRIKEEISEARSPAVLAEIKAFEEEVRKIERETNLLENAINALRSETENILEREITNIEKILKDIKKKEEGAKKEKGILEKELKKKEKELKDEEKKESSLLSKFKELLKRRNTLTEEQRKLEENKIELITKQKQYEINLNNLSLERAKILGQVAALEEELKDFKDVEAFKDKPIEKAKREIREFERMIATMNVNLKALETYEKSKEELNKLEEKKKILEREKADVLKLINEIDTKKKEIFLRTFNAINKNFSVIFKLLSTTGEAFLQLEDEKDPFNGGIEIKVRLKGKKFLDILSLSGGEKTLTALAFIFSIQEYEPAFFYIFDEVDAALDKRNSEKLGQLIAEYSKKAQYIVISHNDAVIENAHYLYGVSIDKDGVSKITSLEI